MRIKDADADNRGSFSIGAVASEADRLWIHLRSGVRCDQAAEPLRDGGSRQGRRCDVLLKVAQSSMYARDIVPGQRAVAWNSP